MRKREYRVSVPRDAVSAPRWELYKMLAEPIRLRLLALAGQEELAIGELAELTGESQPNVSRHLKPLRTGGLLVERKEGTRVYVRLDETRAQDPVVRDALRTGVRLCEETGSLERVEEVVAAREAAARDFFATTRQDVADEWPTELGAYLAALAPLVTRRGLAVDVGTGHGSLLEVIAPVFEKVIAFDRSEAQLEAARARLAQRGFRHVETFAAELGDEVVKERVKGQGGADAVFAARVLHHAPKPAVALAELTELLAPGGTLLVLDYASHDDESMRKDQADVWLGFSTRELKRFAEKAGLEGAAVTKIPAIRCGAGPDGHLDWQVLAARKSMSKEIVA